MRTSIDRYRELCAQGLNAVQIATRLRVNKNTVYQNCKRHGITVASVLAGKPNSQWRSNDH